MKNYLEFEKPLAEIEGKAEELRAMARQNEEMDVGKEAAALDDKAASLLEVMYKKLTPWQKCQVARHPDRPHCIDYIERCLPNSPPSRVTGTLPTITLLWVVWHGLTTNLSL